MPLDPFSIENMKTELARATNKQADIWRMISKWSRVKDGSDLQTMTDRWDEAITLINDVNERNNQP